MKEYSGNSGFVSVMDAVKNTRPETLKLASVFDPGFPMDKLMGKIRKDAEENAINKLKNYGQQNPLYILYNNISAVQCIGPTIRMENRNS